LHSAYCSHYPIELSPDIIWIAITQGFSKHVNNNAKKLRHHFVKHEGKVDIQIRMDHFVKGKENPWPDVFPLFSEQIGKHVGDIQSTLVADFSTTTPIEKIISEIVLMESFKQYFDYGMETCCWIPEIRLRGTVSDWEKLKEKASLLQKYDLDWWIPSLLKVLDQFIAIYKTPQLTVETYNFWASIYKFKGGSGGNSTSGWINVLMPYLSGSSKNYHLKNSLKPVLFSTEKSGPDPNEYPNGVSYVPWTCSILNPRSQWNSEEVLWEFLRIPKQ